MSADPEALDLGTLEPVEVSVKIGTECFVLREATAADAAAFKNAAMAGVKLDDGKMVGIGRAPADAEAVLVGRCLHRETKEGWRPVGETFAKTLPARVHAKLYAKARQISGMDDDEAGETAAGKGGPESTGSTST